MYVRSTAIQLPGADSEARRAKPLALVTANPDLRELVKRDLESLGCRVAAIDSATALLAFLDQVGQRGFGGILLDDELSAEAPSTRAALLAAVEAVAGSLDRVVPLVAPEVAKGWSAIAPDRHLSVASSRDQMQRVISRLERLETEMDSLDAAPADAEREWLRPEVGETEFPGEEWLYRALLVRFRERCSDLALRVAALISADHGGELDRLLLQTASGARRLAAFPLADAAVGLAATVRERRWRQLAPRLRDFQEALVETFAAAGRYLAISSTRLQSEESTEVALERSVA